MVEPVSEKYRASVGVNRDEYEAASERILALLVGRGMTAAQVRKALGTDAHISSILNLLCDQGLLARGKPPAFSATLSTSATPNSPMTTGTSSIPLLRLTLPMVNRLVKEIGSIPTVAITNPNARTIRLYQNDPPDMRERANKPSAAKEKNSGAPKLRARSASPGAKNMIKTTPPVPAIKEPTAATARAAPALPFLAISYPSRQVMTEAASPGTLTRMDVVEPPYRLP